MAVLSGGYVAIDCVESALKLGAKVGQAEHLV
jgi:NADPH-dependent glutamate synthase beta subunit-like oxidoreductase